MPALIDYRSCDDSPYCGAARFCPKNNFEMRDGRWVIDAAACGGCAGACVRACPPGAIRHARTMEELEQVRLEIESSTETADDLFEKRYGVRPGDPHELGTNLDNVDCSTFDRKVLQADLPVVVDFWADWCVSCKLVVPTFKKLAAEYAGRMQFMKLDTEDCQQVAARYGIRSIPTMLFFKGGQMVALEIGALPEQRLRQSIDAVLSAA